MKKYKEETRFQNFKENFKNANEIELACLFKDLLLLLPNR